MTNTRLSTLALLGVVSFLGCSGGEGGEGQAGALTGAVQVDGSSTVLPVTEAVAEEFQIENPNVGDGRGLQPLLRG